MKKLIVFDLDGTLAQSKSALDPEMAKLLTALLTVDEMIYVGDAVFPGGNDYPAKEAGAPSIQVRDPHETKRVVEAIIVCLDGVPPARIYEEGTQA